MKHISNGNFDACFLRSILSYNSKTGVFIWKIYRSSNARIGMIAGYNDLTLGGRIIRIGKAFYAHRLAWLYHYGKWPKSLVDHINGDGFDNRIINLREATNAQNLWNRPAQKNNLSGLKGVSYFKPTKKWRARIMANGITYYLGHYSTKQEAHHAYINAAKKLHGEFSCY